MRKLIDLWRLKTQKYYVIDDFFSDDTCAQLRSYALKPRAEEHHELFWDYYSLDYDVSIVDKVSQNHQSSYIKNLIAAGTPPQALSLRNLLPQIQIKVPLAEESKYHRAWSFSYDTVSNGIPPHADPSFIQINIWVTPDECVFDHEKNGLIVYKRQAPSDWPWEDYNGNDRMINHYLEGSDYDVIPYKCNRAVVFEGKTFHASQQVHMKPGHKNKRVNFTFLYGGEDPGPNKTIYV